MLRHHFKIILTLSISCFFGTIIIAFGSLALVDTNLVLCMIGGVILEFQVNFASMLTLSLSILRYFFLKKFSSQSKIILLFQC